MRNAIEAAERAKRDGMQSEVILSDAGLQEVIWSSTDSTAATRVHTQPSVQ